MQERDSAPSGWVAVITKTNNLIIYRPIKPAALRKFIRDRKKEPYNDNKPAGMYDAWIMDMVLCDETLKVADIESIHIKR